MIEWRKHIMDDRITFDAAWTKMGLHHDVPRNPPRLTRCSRPAKTFSGARRPTMSSRHRRPVVRCRASPRWSIVLVKESGVSPSLPCMT